MHGIQIAGNAISKPCENIINHSFLRIYVGGKAYDVTSKWNGKSDYGVFSMSLLDLSERLLDFQQNRGKVPRSLLSGYQTSAYRDWCYDAEKMDQELLTESSWSELLPL